MVSLDEEEVHERFLVADAPHAVRYTDRTNYNSRPTQTHYKLASSEKELLSGVGRNWAGSGEGKGAVEEYESRNV